MLERLADRLDHLSPAERRVGRWILEHPRQAAFATVDAVARAAGTSQPTVVRCCRSLGLAGFRELKVRLAAALGRPASYLHRDVSRDDSSAEAAGKVIDRSIQALVDTRSELDIKPFDAAVDTLLRARQIVFAGCGASGHVAADACHKFFRLGLACCATADVPTMLQQAAIAKGETVFVMISQSGQTTGSVTAAAAARRHGAPVIAVTAAGTALAAEASTLLACPHGDDAGLFTPMSSRLAQLALLDALQVATALALGPAAEDRLRASKAALTQTRGS